MEDFQINNFQGDDYQGDYLTNTDDNKSRKTKTIIVASIAGVVVLAAAIWGIASIVSSVNSKNAGHESDVVAENTGNNKTESLGQGTVSPADQYTAQNPTTEDLPVLTQPETPAEIPAAENVPETGPSDLLITAVLMGVSTALLLSMLMKKAEA